MTKLFHDAFVRDKKRCVYCGKDMLQDFETFMSIQEDHLMPRSKKGVDEHENVVISCNVCNMLKGNYYPEDIGELDRGKIISTIRKHIIKRRAEKLKDFLYWVNPEETDYHT